MRQGTLLMCMARWLYVSLSVGDTFVFSAPLISARINLLDSCTCHSDLIIILSLMQSDSLQVASSPSRAHVIIPPAVRNLFDSVFSELKSISSLDKTLQIIKIHKYRYFEENAAWSIFETMSCSLKSCNKKMNTCH